MRRLAWGIAMGAPMRASSPSSATHSLQFRHRHIALQCRPVGPHLAALLVPLPRSFPPGLQDPALRGWLPARRAAGDAAPQLVVPRQHEPGLRAVGWVGGSVGEPTGAGGCTGRRQRAEGRAAGRGCREARRLETARESIPGSQRGSLAQARVACRGSVLARRCPGWLHAYRGAAALGLAVASGRHTPHSRCSSLPLQRAWWPLLACEDGLCGLLIRGEHGARAGAGTIDECKAQHTGTWRPHPSPSACLCVVLGIAGLVELLGLHARLPEGTNQVGEGGHGAGQGAPAARAWALTTGCPGYLRDMQWFH